MQGGDNQVSGDCRSDRDLRRLCVTCLTDHDDIRVLTEQSTQSHGKGHAGSHIYRRLGNIGQVLFHRILDGGNVYRTLRQTLQYHVKRGRLTGTGRPCDVDNAVRRRHHFHQHIVGIIVHAEVSGVVDLGI